MGAQVTISANQIDKQRLGYQAVSLTHFSDTAEPSMAAGSKIECGGALFEIASDEAGTGWGGIGVSNAVYFYMLVSGTTSTWYYSTTAPTWSTSKQGWYGTGGAVLDRCFGRCYKDSGGLYTLKWLYAEHDQVGSIKRYGNGAIHADGAIDTSVDFSAGTTIHAGTTVEGHAGVIAGHGNVARLTKEINIGDWNMTTTQSVTIAHGLTGTKIRGCSVLIQRDDGHLVPFQFGWANITGVVSLGGLILIDGTNVLLDRGLEGTTPYFTGTAFDDTSYNRGWITIEYVP